MFRRGPVKRIGFPEDVRTTIEALILFHLRPGQYEPGWTDSAVRRFHRETEPFLRDLLDLGRADITSKRPGKRAACLRSIHALAERIEALAAEDAKPKPLPAAANASCHHHRSAGRTFALIGETRRTQELLRAYHMIPLLRPRVRR